MFQNIEIVNSCFCGCYTRINLETSPQPTPSLTFLFIYFEHVNSENGKTDMQTAKETDSRTVQVKLNSSRYAVGL